MLYRQTITLINVNNSKGELSIVPVLIDKAHYQDRHSNKTGTIEQLSNNNGYARFKHDKTIDDKTYLPEGDYALLLSKGTDMSDYWTVRVNDLIYNGELPKDITHEQLFSLYKTRSIIGVEFVDYGIIIPKEIGLTLK